jgi:6-pyruvoyltetrahydropterin/6-carboxytetrahydropterin synthase
MSNTDSTLFIYFTQYMLVKVYIPAQTILPAGVRGVNAIIVLDLQCGSPHLIMPMVITRKVEFSASHVCRNPALTEEENRRLFGPAANPHGHGHNYVLEVSLQGDPDPVTGMVLDLKELKDVLNREVVEPYDHRFLNYEVPPFDRVIPTTENIARDIWRRLEPHLCNEKVRLHSVRVYETPDLYVDYFGEQPCSA